MPTGRPDCYTAIVPSTTRWAPGTQFGSFRNYTSIPAGQTYNFDFAIPNDGYSYVLDTIFFQTLIIGTMSWSVWVCNDYGAPSWIMVGNGDDNKCAVVRPFSFVSMVLKYPMAIRCVVVNNNIIERWAQINMTSYRYLGGA